MKYFSYMLNKKYSMNLYFVFRVLVGLGFLTHGASKLFGENPVSLFSVMGFAGIVEFFGGILIVLGLFTSVSALFGAIVMIGAWVKVHMPRGWNPMENGGELAMIYFAAMLVLIAFGAKSCGLEKKIFKKEFLHK